MGHFACWEYVWSSKVNAWVRCYQKLTPPCNVLVKPTRAWAGLRKVNLRFNDDNDMIVHQPGAAVQCSVILWWGVSLLFHIRVTVKMIFLQNQDAKKKKKSDSLRFTWNRARTTVIFFFCPCCNSIILLPDLLWNMCPVWPTFKIRTSVGSSLSSGLRLRCIY